MTFFSDRFSTATAGPSSIGIALTLVLLPVSSTPEAVAQETTHQSHAAAQGSGHQAGNPLSQSGNAAFAAIQEVVRILEKREGTDWTRVDLEALRQHLLDMRRFTLEARIEEREPVEGGLRVVVTGDGATSSEGIRRSLRAHAPMLEKETRWSAEVNARGNRTTLIVTGESPSDAAKIRGLGYIGLMATGAHHQRHHWMIATGRSPHRQ